MRWLVPLLAFLMAAAVSGALVWLLLGGSSAEEAPAPAAPLQPAVSATPPPTATPHVTPSATPTATASPATPVATASPRVSPTPSAEATDTPATAPTDRRDFPDLVVSDVFSRDNQLVVVVSNTGTADANGLIEVSIDGGPPQRIDTGKALRPGDLLEQPLDGEFVQRRTQVVVTVRASAAIVERNAGNNVFVGVVTPDAPNDIAVIDVEYGGSGPHLIATIRNRSPIPLRGEVTIGIREIAPEDRLLLREGRDLDVASGATQSFEFPAITSSPLESVRVIVSTDAINDADASNDALPRWGGR